MADKAFFYWRETLGKWYPGVVHNPTEYFAWPTSMKGKRELPPEQAHLPLNALVALFPLEEEDGGQAKD